MPAQFSREFSLPRFLVSRPDLRARLETIKQISARVRTTSYQVTRECNLRCAGCWYYANGMDETAEDVSDPGRIREIVRGHAERGTTHALIAGGEPMLFPERLAVFVETLPYVSIATNGYRAPPREGFENCTIGLALFAGVRSDDQYRAITAGGRRFTGLIERGLGHYRNDPRVTVVYALSELAIDEIEPTIQRIGDNGNRAYFSYYRYYDSKAPAEAAALTERLIDTALAVRERHPEIVLSHPNYIRALITGSTSWGTFGHESCATVSTGHPDNQERIRNGRPMLPHFESYAQDFKTQRMCCVSADCTNCRDSLAVSSWMLVNFREHARSAVGVVDWIEFAETYWSSYYWSPLHWSRRQTQASPPPRALDPAIVSAAE
jgi:hypothetical protein